MNGLDQIKDEHHGMLLYRLSELPYGDPQVAKLEHDLKEYLQQYQALIKDLDETVRAYLETARKIKALKPLKDDDRTK